MRYTPQQIEELKTLREKIKDVKVAMLTTMDYSRESLHSRPMSTLPKQKEDEDDTLWFFTYSNSEKADEIRHKGNVNLSYMDKDSDLYVSVSGTAEVTDNLELVKQKWSPILKAWFPDGYDNPNVALIKVHITEGEYWDSDAGLMRKLFSMVKAVVTGERADMGAEHEKTNFRKA